MNYKIGFSFLIINSLSNKTVISKGDFKFGAIMTHICCKVIHQSRYHQQNNCAYFSQSCEGQLEKEVEAVNDAHVTSLHCCKVLQHEVPDLKEQEVTGVRSLKTLLHFETIRLCISLFIHVFAKCKCFQLEHKIFGLSYETFYHVNECKKQPREFYLYCNYNKVESVTCPLTAKKDHLPN